MNGREVLRWLPRLPRPRLPRWHRRPEAPRQPVVAGGMLRAARVAALVLISVLVLAASVVSFAESYRALYDWAAEHGLSGTWALIWPLQVDVFIAVGELALFVALADGWARRSRAGAWAVTLTGLAVSVAGNVGHVTSHHLANRTTAAVPPIAAAAALAVGLGVLKRVIEHHHQAAEIGQSLADLEPAAGTVPADAESAARTALAASIAGGNPLSQNALQARFRLTRAQTAKLRREVLAASNGHAPGQPSPAGEAAP